MHNGLAKNLFLAGLVIATLGLLSHVLMSLRKGPTPVEKTIVKKVEDPEPQPHGLIKEALMPKQSELEDCYENFLRTKPEVSEGSITINWLIDAQGSVLSTELAKSEIENASLTECVLEKLKGLSFAPPPEHRQTVLAYKLRFKRKTQAALNFGE